MALKNEQKDVSVTDTKILYEMVKNCRRSYRELAAATGMSPAALIEHVKRLEKEAVITRYVANLDYLKLGFEFMALVEINIAGKDLLDVERRIGKIPRVAAVWDTTGEYDALAVVMCKSRSELSATVKKILSMEGVKKTSTNIVLNVVKRLSEFDEID